jgi:hypothetical protein
VRGQAALPLLISLPLCACAPPAEPLRPTALALDCSLPFEAQAAKLTAQPHLLPPAHAAAEPYLFYATEDGRASYLITEKGAPGHPAIMMQRAQGRQVKTTGCSYGDPKGYRQLFAYLDSLQTWTRQ